MVNKFWQYIWQNEICDIPISLILLFISLILIPGLIVGLLTHSWIWAVVAGLGGGGLSFAILIYILNKVFGDFN